MNFMGSNGLSVCVPCWVVLPACLVCCVALLMGALFAIGFANHGDSGRCGPEGRSLVEMSRLELLPYCAPETPNGDGIATKLYCYLLLDRTVQKDHLLFNSIQSFNPLPPCTGCGHCCVVKFFRTEHNPFVPPVTSAALCRR